MYLLMRATGGIRLAATSSSCVQRPAAARRAVLGAAARSERVLRGVVRIEEVEVRLGQDVAVVESDSSKAESDALLGKVLMVRFEHYGWCKGTITGKVVDRRRTINKEAINFIAEFDIDDGASTDLSLDVSEYDPSPSADYQSWLLLQEAAG